MMYANGKGVEQDYRLARDWFRKAGEAGHALAKENATHIRGIGGVRIPDAAPSGAAPSAANR
jgi:TPR repeat protein